MHYVVLLSQLSTEFMQLLVNNACYIIAYVSCVCVTIPFVFHAWHMINYMKKCPPCKHIMIFTICSFIQMKSNTIRTYIVSSMHFDFWVVRNVVKARKSEMSCFWDNAN